MDKSKLLVARAALEQIALREGRSVDEVRADISRAMSTGINSENGSIRAYWQHVPREGGQLTPEELILFLAEEAKKP